MKENIKTDRRLLLDSTLDGDCSEHSPVDIRTTPSNAECEKFFDYTMKRSLREKFLEVFEGIGMCLSLVYEGAREQYKRWKEKSDK